ncbi:MAG: GDSL-type esterase/lipase family protein [Vicinamibacterales bacterium]
MPKVDSRVMRLLSLMFVVAVVSGCNSSAPSTPTAPTPPPTPPPVVVVPDPPTVVCPSAVSSTTTGTALAVSYTTPSAEGGQAPVTVACAPASGSTFPIGANEVRCTATDSLNRSASCVFGVTVSRLATISKTKFLAFGDSITVGTVSTLNPSGDPPYINTDVPGASYPTVLRQLLAARYASQAITMINEGKGGERAVDGVGRASSVFNANRPEVALIMDGYNDLGAGEAGIDPAIAAINDMVKDARFRGARVFVATLTPPPVNVNRGISNTTIVRFNDKLKIMARGENAVLVDVYAAWASDPNRYNSADGRHPNEAGYRKIAETFFAAIQAELEVK